MSLPELLERTRKPLNLALTPVAGGLAMAAALPGDGKLLSFNMETQKREEWCWAAVSVSVARFYQSSSTWRQCSLVNDELGLSSCCQNGATADCNQPWYLENGLARVAHLAEKVEIAISFDAVANEIDNDRPVGCWIRWLDNTGHFVVLNGYSRDFASAPTKEYVSVRDPKYGKADYPFAKFLTSYRTHGSWELSYLTRS